MAPIRVCLAVVVTLSLVTVARGQSLADAAKAAEEARTKASPPDATNSPGKNSTKKVYTDKDLKDVPSFSPAAPEAKPEPTAKDAPKKTETARANEPPLRDEAWWRARMTELRAALEKAQKERQAKATLVARLEAVRDNVPDHGFSVAQAYANASAELAKARADLDVCVANEKAAKAAINAAEEDARTHNVLPGWLR